jgi:hypothetical protein
LASKEARGQLPGKLGKRMKDIESKGEELGLKHLVPAIIHVASQISPWTAAAYAA